MEGNDTGTARLRFNFRELAGSVGDFGTIFPIVLGVALVTDLNLSTMLFFFGVWFIIAGLYYRLPIPIEPMKAIGAIVIAGSLTSAEVAASGIIIGMFFLGAGLLKGMGWLRGYIPQSVIRGVQGGLALILLRTAVGYGMDDLLPFALAVLVIIGFFLLARRTRIPDISALLVIALGFAGGIYLYGIPEFSLPALPVFSLPALSLYPRVTWELVLPQVPLTITNAILATSLLTMDLFKREVEPDRLSMTIGLMNLVSVPFGGMPMCHGAGGLAAQYRFGARTGGANVYAGIILFALALLFASSDMLALFPTGIFGALLVFVAIELGRHSLKTDSYLVSGIMVILAFFAGMAVAFVAGIILAYATAWYAKRTTPKTENEK
jgi:MFS superfamily sulfate permease-like transporter